MRRSCLWHCESKPTIDPEGTKTSILMSFCLFSPLPTDSAMHSSVTVLLLLSSDQFSAARADHQADTLVPCTKRCGTSFCARRTHAQVIATVISLMSSSLSSRSTVRFTPSVSVSSSSSSRPISNVVVFQQTVIVWECVECFVAFVMGP